MNRARRVVNYNTILICGEGSDDTEWLKYLKATFATRNCKIKIKNGNGGSPVYVINKMTHIEEFSSYNKKYALIDSDRPETDEALLLAKKNKITVIQSKQCIEVELLKIHGATGGTLKRARESSKNAKDEYSKIGKHNQKSYSKLFPKNKLQNERKKGNKWLNDLIQIFEE